MGKSLKYGSHDFPTTAGFTGSSGRIAMVRPHRRTIGVPKSRLTPMPGPPKAKVTMKQQTPVSVPTGTALQPRRRPTTAVDKAVGPQAPLLPGYKKGGLVKDKC